MLNYEQMLGVGLVVDIIDFMKKMWSSMGVFVMVMFLLLVEDINKKISDLKIVVFWLELNLNMFKVIIQILEVQSVIFFILQVMSEIMVLCGMFQVEVWVEEEGSVVLVFFFGFLMWLGVGIQFEEVFEEEEEFVFVFEVVEE